jgi:hypothetical protein
LCGAKTGENLNLRDILIKLKDESGQESWALNKLLSAMPEIKAYLANALAVPYTSHDWSHAETVEELCANLVKKELLHSLNETELFILIISIWLHDAGMVPKNAQQSDDDTRASHYRRIQDIIKADELVFLYDLDNTLRGHIADICFNHGQNSPVPLKPRVLYKGQPIRLQLIASLLRLSDICDIREYHLAYTGLITFQKQAGRFGRLTSLSVVLNQLRRMIKQQSFLRRSIQAQDKST